VDGEVEIPGAAGNNGRSKSYANRGVCSTRINNRDSVVLSSKEQSCAEPTGFPQSGTKQRMALSEATTKKLPINWKYFGNKSCDILPAAFT